MYTFFWQNLYIYIYIYIFIYLYIYTNTYTIIIYNSAQTCGNPPTCFGLFRLSSGWYSTKKNTLMASYLHRTYGHKLYTITNSQGKSYKNPIRLSTCVRLKHYWPLLHFCLLTTILTIPEKGQNT